MNGYEPLENRHQPEFWRQVDSTPASLAEALTLLPPDTKIETGESEDLTAVWYYPDTKMAFIG